MSPEESRLDIRYLVDEDTSIGNLYPEPYYTSTASGDPKTFTYTIASNDQPDSGVSIDSSNNIDIHPIANWNGVATVTVQVDNGASNQNASREGGLKLVKL